MDQNLGTWFKMWEKKRSLIWLILHPSQMYERYFIRCHSRQQEPWEIYPWFNLRKIMCCTLKVYKVGVTKHCCDISMPFDKVQSMDVYWLRDGMGCYWHMWNQKSYQILSRLHVCCKSTQTKIQIISWIWINNIGSIHLLRKRGTLVVLSFFDVCRK